VKAPDFDYLRPETLAEAMDMLSRHGEDGAIIAGGQSLLPLLNFRLAGPERLIDIGRLAALKQIVDGDGFVEIGALVRHCDLASSEAVARAFPLLRQAVGHIAHPAVRHRGTIGGSLAMADPAAELGACCLALEAEMSLQSVRGQRWVRAVDFFAGIYETALAPDEILTAVRLPRRGPDSVQIFSEVARRRGDFAIAGLALVADNHMANPRLALLGVADRPILAEKTMALLANNMAAADQAIELIGNEIDPAEDPAYPPAYRRQLVRTLLRRTLMELLP
jgi:aerobic carbon-monoxide dehydrogenase medium subunit